MRIDAEGDLGETLRSRSGDLAELFIVSQVSIDGRDGGPTTLPAGLKVSVERASGEKCQRCWNFSEAVGQDVEHPALCDRCARVVKGIVSAAPQPALAP